MNTNMNLQRISADRLKPAKYNPRKDLKPGDPAYEKIKRSLHEFGYVDPVIWNEVTGNIVGGHQRYKVLTAEGATEIDCVVVHIEVHNDPAHALCDGRQSLTPEQFDDLAKAVRAILPYSTGKERWE